MTTDLKPEDRALILQTLGEDAYPFLATFSYAPSIRVTAQQIASLLDAARAEGLRSSSGGGEGEEGFIPERVTGGCADAGPFPHSPDMLAWLAEHRSLELDYGFDAEEEDMFWRVHERSGNVNDREWDLIGQGATPLAALLSAKSYLESVNAEQPE